MTPTNQGKVYENAAAALFDLTDGIRLMSGGFGLCGIPENSIQEIMRRGIKNIHAISNNIGNSGRGLAYLLKNRQIVEATCSYVGGNPDLEEQMLNEEVKVNLVPQGTFSERIRAAGMGIRGFYTPTGAGTVVAEGKEVREFDRPCLLELPLHADFAIIKAQQGDPYGNLWFQETARNFSPLMAMAATTTIVEVEELVELGAIPGENVHLPGIFVQRIYQGRDYENAMEIPVFANSDNQATT
jgi:3-oxoacid CoA-transferase subunit A